MEMLMESCKKEAVFAVQCNRSLLEYNQKRSGEHIVDLPDAVAMGVVLWPEIVLDSVECFCKTCIIDPYTYGQVIVDDGSVLAVSDGFIDQEPNAVMCKSIDNKTFKSKMFNLLLE
jgi:purine nucleosidase